MLVVIEYVLICYSPVNLLTLPHLNFLDGALVGVFVLLVVLMVLGCSYFAFVLYKRHRDDEEVQQVKLHT